MLLIRSIHVLINRKVLLQISVLCACLSDYHFHYNLVCFLLTFRTFFSCFSTPINAETIIVSFMGFRSFLKNFLVCLKQLIQEYNLCQQLHHLVLICIAKRRCHYHIIELSFSLSFHIPYILKCNQLPKLLSSLILLVMTKSYFYTSPNSTSGQRDGELKFLYPIWKLVNQCVLNHIHEPFASSTANLTGKVEVAC